MAKLKSDFVYRHWRPAAQFAEDFPFSYTISQIKNFQGYNTVQEYFEEYPADIELSYTAGSDLKQKIRYAIIKQHDFVNTTDYASLYYTIKINMMGLEEVTTKTGRVKQVTVIKAVQGVVVHNFVSSYKFGLVKSLEQLEKLLANVDRISFDSETTGLNPETDEIVGVSFSLGNKTGYYVPIKHAPQFESYNLGKPALLLIYNAMRMANRVYMFNARFDMRMLEYTDNQLYDMLNVRLSEVQINAHYADPEYRKHDLKSLEKHFMGYHRPDLAETLRSVGIDGYSVELINPEKIVFYAAADAISTYELGEIAYQYFLEFGLAAQIDNLLVPRLMRLENRSMRIDTKYIEQELPIIRAKVAELDAKLKASVGEVNLSSAKQREALFKSFGLDTGQYTEKGQMKTGNKEISALIDTLTANKKAIPDWLTYMNEFAKYKKMDGSFFGSLLEQVKEVPRVRINYRLGNVVTGRLSSGADLHGE